MPVGYKVNILGASFWGSPGSRLADRIPTGEQGSETRGIDAGKSHNTNPGSKKGEDMMTRIPERRLARIRGRARASSETATSAPTPSGISGKSISLLFSTAAADLPEGLAERRRASRVETGSEILVRRIGGFNFNVALKDISTGGCRVELLEPGEVGDPVVTRLPRLEPLGARVCWAEGTTTGVQFLTNIHPAVFEMLLTRLSPAAGPALPPG